MAEMTALSKEYGAGITCHSFNADYTKIAICPNSSELHIYGKGADGAWSLEHKLTEHDMLISGVDWNPVTNCIVTASHDRNAFVWNEEQDPTGPGTVWKPSLVILRIDKSALDVRWSPNGLKFAAASGAKCVSVCSFADEDNWWVSKTIKKHKSTVLCLAWHPNSQLLATGSSDFKCRVFSAYISTDGKPDPPTPDPCQGKVVEFGEAYYEFPTCSATVGWVNAVAWSPSGQTLGFANQDSSLVLVTFPTDNSAPVEQVIKFPELPLSSLCFVSEIGLVGAGHGFSPLGFGRGDGGFTWALAGALEAEDKENAPKPAVAAVGGAASARAMFEKMNSSSKPASKDATPKASSAWKKHQAPVTCMTPYSVKAGSATVPTLATTAMDGRLVIWDLKKSKVPAPILGL